MQDTAEKSDSYIHYNQPLIKDVCTEAIHNVEGNEENLAISGCRRN